MSRYAEKTEVTSDRSRAEIERTLTRYGADQFLYAWQADTAVIGFRMRGRMIRLVLQMPDRNDREFRFTPSRNYERSKEAQQEAYEQACRQRWRALALLVKAKLEAVEAGLVELEEEFLSHVVLPDGRRPAIGCARRSPRPMKPDKCRRCCQCSRLRAR